tara:strand:- start:221 stop:898 length:678 start_codon:yes stop_codon:yes gene_type:complete
MKYGHYNDRGLPESDHGYRCPSWDPMPSGKKNVVVLGCSHTYGVGHDNNTHWVHFLSQHNTKRLRYWNLGQPGASADKIVRILYGCEKLIDPRIIIVCWPVWSRRERLGKYAESLTSDAEQLAIEDSDTDKNNFLKNVFFVQKYAEKNNAKVFHCFAQDSYHEHIKDPNVLQEYTIKNCWPYWDKFTARDLHFEPSLAADGKHFGVEHHKRFAELFLERFGPRLK